MRRILLFFIAAHCLVMNGQDISVRAWFDTSTIYIGDQVNYNIEVIQPASMSLMLNQPADSLSKILELLSQPVTDTIETGKGEYSITTRYLVTSFDTGLYEMPPQFAAYNLDGELVRVYSDYASLKVIRTSITPADSTDVIFDIIGPVRERVTAREIFPWIALLLLIVVAAFLIARWVINRKGKLKADIIDRIPGEPLHITTLRELDKLERQELWQKGHVKEYYSRMTDILRRFIDLRYDVSSLELTSSETLLSLLNAGVERDDNYNRLSEILTTADLSKFAKHKPEPEVNSSMIDLSRLFVRTSCKNSENTSVETDRKPEQGKEVGNE